MSQQCLLAIHRIDYRYFISSVIGCRESRDTFWISLLPIASSMGQQADWPPCVCWIAFPCL